MRRVLGHIVMTFLVLISFAGCHRNGRIIPASTLEKIYVDMFMADQWIKGKSDERKKADTTWFYEPIFRSYGYNSKDYDVTVSYYVDRPDKYVKVLNRAAKMLNIKHLETYRIAEKIRLAHETDQAGFGYVVSDFHNADSILFGSMVLDSLLIRDSVYIKEPEPDTLAVADTLPSMDAIVTIQTIQVPNVERRDSVRADQKQAPRKFSGHKPVAVPGKNL